MATLPTTETKTSAAPTEDDIELEVVGEWTDEHTKVIAQLLVDLEEK